MREKHGKNQIALINAVGIATEKAANDDDLWPVADALHVADDILSDVFAYLDRVIAKGKTLAETVEALKKVIEEKEIELRKYESNIPSL